jgi:hypothetical protein
MKKRQEKTKQMPSGSFRISPTRRIATYLGLGRRPMRYCQGPRDLMFRPPAGVTL